MSARGYFGACCRKWYLRSWTVQRNIFAASQNCGWADCDWTYAPAGKFRFRYTPLFILRFLSLLRTEETDWLITGSFHPTSHQFEEGTRSLARPTEGLAFRIWFGCFERQKSEIWSRGSILRQRGELTEIIRLMRGLMSLKYFMADCNYPARLVPERGTA